MIRDIERDQVQRLVEQGAQLVEVLPADDYQDAHLPGALNLPLKKLTAASVQQWDREKAIIVYCYDFQ